MEGKKVDIFKQSRIFRRQLKEKLIKYDLIDSIKAIVAVFSKEDESCELRVELKQSPLHKIVGLVSSLENVLSYVNRPSWLKYSIVPTLIEKI